MRVVAVGVIGELSFALGDGEQFAGAREVAKPLATGKPLPARRRQVQEM